MKFHTTNDDGNNDCDNSIDNNDIANIIVYQKYHHIQQQYN